MSVELQARNELEEARFEAYRRYEELTDISERLSAPVETHSSFVADENGRVFADTGEKLIRVVSVVKKGLDEASEVANWRSDIGFEVTRRRIELQEALDVESLARGELGGDTMVVLSPVPDAVRAGNTSISGYHRERLRCMVRIYQRRDAGHIDTITMSLDQSDYDGLRAITGTLGGSLPDGLSSEEVLARRAVLNIGRDGLGALPIIIRETYDRELRDKLGGDWYAGSRFKAREDALTYIRQHPDLITEHMHEISKIVGSTLAGNDCDAGLESLRQLTAAAFDARLHGNHVGSIGDAVVSEMASRGDYSGDCPTSLTETRSINQETSFSAKQCPICGEKNVTGHTKNGFIYGSCGCSKEICGPKVVNGRAMKLARAAMSDSFKAQSNKRALSKKELLLASYGKYAEIKSTPVFGGAKQYVVDRRTNETIAEL